MNAKSSDSKKLTGVEVIRLALKDMPGKPGVYRMLSEQGEVLYIGKAKNLKNRVGNYANIGQLPLRLQRMVMSTHVLDINITASEADALLLEATLIKNQGPRYNILLKDDKSYPYIHFSGSHDFPRITKYRGPKKKDGRHFGPFISATAVDETITLLQKAFLLRPCSDNVFKNRSRPCLQYQIHRCSAPCVDYVSKKEYDRLIRQAIDTLSGKSSEILDALASEMQQASDDMEYEHAALLRDRIRALSFIQDHAGVRLSGLHDADLFALAQQDGKSCVQAFCFREGNNYGSQPFFPRHTEDEDPEEIMSAFLGQYYQRHVPAAEILVSVEPAGKDLLEEALEKLAGRKVKISVPQRGGKRQLLEQSLTNAETSLLRHRNESLREKKLLEGLRDLFELSDIPERIEVYDNSHISGTNAVGAMVVAGQDGLMKQAYRQFNIKSSDLTPGDDYAMMREVLTRRFQRMMKEEEKDEKAQKWNRPDLVIIDGGAGQLSAAQGVMDELGLGSIPLVAIAKGKDRNAGREWMHQPEKKPFQLPKDDPVLHYLQRLRDEAHRFAIGTHRSRRSKSATRSELDAIAGIGPKRKKALLRRFGSVRGVSAASLQDLQNVEGVSVEMAKMIYEYFHRD